MSPDSNKNELGLITIDPGRTSNPGEPAIAVILACVAAMGVEIPIAQRRDGEC